MDLVLLEKILSQTSQLPFLGTYTFHPNLQEIGIANCCYLLVDLIEKHYSLAGLFVNRFFHFDTIKFQKRPVCGLYTVLLSWVIPNSIFNRQFLQSFDNPGSNNKIDFDLLVVDTVAKALRHLDE